MLVRIISTHCLELLKHLVLLVHVVYCLGLLLVPYMREVLVVGENILLRYTLDIVTLRVELLLVQVVKFMGWLVAVYIELLIIVASVFLPGIWRN